MDFRHFSVLISGLRMKHIELISLDAEGTLVTPDFSQAIWHEAIPALDAERKGLDLAQAKSEVYSQYDAVGSQRLEWYDIDYWFAHFDLGSPGRVIEGCAHRVTYYPEITDVLAWLAGKHRLIVASGAPAEMLEFLLRDIRPYFVRTFSSVSHYRELKSPHFYRKLCEEMGVRPGGVLHIGDNWQFDYINPREAGMNALYLDRSRRNHEASLSDLSQLQSMVLPTG